ncbi:MAG: ABC transporter permease subunit [Acidobacteriota bacterium]|nr:ABC transporter permease subunit [Acidobacteriota bacterium]
MSPLEIAFRKELRALWPAWAVAVIAVGVLALRSDGRDADLGWVALYVGSLTLTGLSIGHEYSNGTLAMMLSQPIERRRLLLAKLGAALPMVALLVAFAVAVLPPGDSRGPSDLPFLSLLCGLVAAPWLTMVCRGPLAGILFGSSITALAHIAGEVALLVRYGSLDTSGADQAAFRMAVLAAGLLGGTLISAIAGWRLFMRLEAVSGPAASIELGRWWPARHSATALSPARSTRRHPLWLLALKELRLQQLTLVVTPAFAAGWVALAIWYGASDVLHAVGFVYYGSLAVLIGSLASAEERHLGTHEWQTLLPIATWQQWSVKLAIVLSLALTVSVVVPTALAAGAVSVRVGHAGAIVLLTVGSLYISSLCRSGLHALAWFVPVLGIALLTLGSRLGPMLFTHQLLLAGALTAAGVAAAWFGFENHRTTKPAARRVAWQALWIAAAPLASVIIAQW